jgi:hypothetical protein
MTDINPDVPDKPIEVPASPVGGQTATGSRDILILLAALPALIAVLGTRDVSTIVAYIGSSEFAPALGLLIAGGTVAWRQWLARRKHANELKMAKSADDSVAVVKRP